MKLLLRIEYLALLLIFGYLMINHPLASPWLLLWFWLPDLGFLPYLINKKWGMYGYNFSHWIGTGTVFLMLGTVFSLPILTLIGFVDLAHISFDRLMGYGLKYGDSFNHTHLGWIGKDKGKN